MPPFSIGHASSRKGVQTNDRAGKPIEGLTAADFTVTENGAPQSIKFCEFQKLADAPDAAAPVDALTAVIVTTRRP